MSVSSSKDEEGQNPDEIGENSTYFLVKAGQSYVEHPSRESFFQFSTGREKLPVIAGVDSSCHPTPVCNSDSNVFDSKEVVSQGHMAEMPDMAELFSADLNEIRNHPSFLGSEKELACLRNVLGMGQLEKEWSVKS